MRQMYAVYGLAMYQAQVMEASVKNALVGAQLADGQFQSLDDLDAASATHFKGMLGRLIGQLKPFFEDDDSLRERLHLALTIRNGLTHHFFWDHAVDATSWSGREAMMHECQNATALFAEIERDLTVAMRRFAERSDLSEHFTPDRLAEQQRGLIARRTSADPTAHCARCGGVLIEMSTRGWKSHRCVGCNAVTLI
ncbi:hypothetical protein [Clavibacter sp. MX14-G9D]|uniref:hypothetical protein n=1 Tax=Clavibacter sp. MX14-G9D TaxID=3064656 RepID=UPI00293EBAE2|nr:hypothetical protein [Clavibacter sp. MX14-G9D]